MSDLISGETGNELVVLMRGDVIVPGRHIEIVARNEHGTFLRRTINDPGYHGQSGPGGPHRGDYHPPTSAPAHDEHVLEII